MMGIQDFDRSKEASGLTTQDKSEMPSWLLNQTTSVLNNPTAIVDDLSEQFLDSTQPESPTKEINPSLSHTPPSAGGNSNDVMAKINQLVASKSVSSPSKSMGEAIMAIIYPNGVSINSIESSTFIKSIIDDLIVLSLNNGNQDALARIAANAIVEANKL